MFINPAGVFNMDGFEWQFSGGYGFETYDRKTAYGTGAYKGDETGAFAVSVFSYGISGIEVYDSGGSFMGEEGSLEMTIGLSYANKFYYQVAYGAGGVGANSGYAASFTPITYKNQMRSDPNLVQTDVQISSNVSVVTVNNITAVASYLYILPDATGQAQNYSYFEAEESMMRKMIWFTSYRFEGQS